MVDKRSTVSPLLVPKPGDNPKVWDLVEEQTLGLEVDLRTGDYERELEAPFYHCWCPGGGGVLVSRGGWRFSIQVSKIHDTHTHTESLLSHKFNVFKKFLHFLLLFVIFCCFSCKKPNRDPLKKKKRKSVFSFFVLPTFAHRDTHYGHVCAGNMNVCEV